MKHKVKEKGPVYTVFLHYIIENSHNLPYSLRLKPLHPVIFLILIEIERID